MPILTVAAVVSANVKKGSFNYVRIAVGPVAITPMCYSKGEEIFFGISVNDEVIKKAVV